jgi:hypothetical protein
MQMPISLPQLDDFDASLPGLSGLPPVISPVISPSARTALATTIQARSRRKGKLFPFSNGYHQREHSWESEDVVSVPQLIVLFKASL